MMGCSKFTKSVRKLRLETINRTRFFASFDPANLPHRNASNGTAFVSHFLKAIFDNRFRFSRPFFGKWNWLVIVKMVNAILGRNLPFLNCSYRFPKAWTDQFVHVNGIQPRFCTMRRDNQKGCAVVVYKSEFTLLSIMSPTVSKWGKFLTLWLSNLICCFSHSQGYLYIHHFLSFPWNAEASWELMQISFCGTQSSF